MSSSESSSLLNDGRYSAESSSRGRAAYGMDEVELGDSSFAKSVILGGMDGVMITVSILCASMGGGLATEVLLVVGFSMLVAQALNIGIGEYLSSKAHRQFVLAEKRRAMWEFKHNPLAKREIMSELFESKGMSRGDAELVTRKMSTYERFFVDLMVTEELRLVLPDDDDATLIFDSLIMCTAFAGLGCIPLLVHCVVPVVPKGDVGMHTGLQPETVHLLGLGVAAVVLFLLGGLKATFSTVLWAYSSMEAVLMGVMVGGAAYLVAQAATIAA